MKIANNDDGNDDVQAFYPTNINKNINILIHT
jgi:hypothetical protein